MTIDNLKKSHLVDDMIDVVRVELNKPTEEAKLFSKLLI